MPVLNVPFRLIFAYNPQRARRATPTTCSRPSSSQFRFAVGIDFLARRNSINPIDSHVSLVLDDRLLARRRRVMTGA